MNKKQKRPTEASNDQLQALCDSYVEGGDDGVKGYLDRDLSILFKLDPEGDIVRHANFARGVHGAIVYKNRSGTVIGRLYHSKASLASAWRAIETKTGRPSWA